jgi:hypothetical protein
MVRSQFSNSCQSWQKSYHDRFGDAIDSSSGQTVSLIASLSTFATVTILVIAAPSPLFAIETNSEPLASQSNIESELDLAHQSDQLLPELESFELNRLEYDRQYRHLITQTKLEQGTLLRGSSAAVYVIDRGGRRLIPDEATFNHLKYDWDQIVQISDQQLNNIPELPAIESVLKQNLVEGTIVKATGSDRLYKIRSGQRREIIDPGILTVLGFKLEDVVSVPPQQLASIPELAPIKDLNDISELSLARYVDGTLVKGSGAAVYLISDNKRRLVPNAHTFEALGYKWEDVQQISDRELAQIPASLPLATKVEAKFKDGTLIKASTPAVYVIISGRRRLIPNAQTFEALGYDWQNVRVIEDAQLNAIPELPPLPTFEGAGGDRQS